MSSSVCVCDRAASNSSHSAEEKWWKFKRNTKLGKHGDISWLLDVQILFVYFFGRSLLLLYDECCFRWTRGYFCICILQHIAEYKIFYKKLKRIDANVACHVIALCSNSDLLSMTGYKRTRHSKIDTTQPTTIVIIISTVVVLFCFCHESFSTIEYSGRIKTALIHACL